MCKITIVFEGQRHTLPIKRDKDRYFIRFVDNLRPTFLHIFEFSYFTCAF